MITVSIVSHGHGAMVQRLIETVLRCPEVSQVVLTLNVAEDTDFSESDKLLIVKNAKPKGFGENHNSAFGLCDQKYFCPVNPDIELIGNPFPGLISLSSATGAALVAPLVRDGGGQVEDSVRYFPSLYTIFLKVLGLSDGSYSNLGRVPVLKPDWVAGMFMLFRSEDYRHLNGFDESFFLYYEDVDICRRLWGKGMSVAVGNEVFVIHRAQRQSHRSFTYLVWHLKSMARYLFKSYNYPPSIGRI